VDAAGDGDVIKVSAGTYTGINYRGGLAQVVYVDKSVTISGGYTAAFTEPPDPDTNPSILDAKGHGRVIYIEGEIHPTIAGLRITGGEAKDLGSPIGIDAGGGVLIVSASATLKDNYIYENSADSTYNGDGGGVYLLDSNATLESNTIISNTAQREGGGIRTHNSPATLTGNTISNNYSGERGDGLFLGFSPATVDGNIISANYGTGLFVDQTTITIINNTIISNIGGDYFCGNATMPGSSGITSPTILLVALEAVFKCSVIICSSAETQFLTTLPNGVVELLQVATLIP
jgi:parallel beta-helix repeat protein